MQASIYKEMAYPVVHVLVHALRSLHARGQLSDDAARFMAETRPAEELVDLHADPHELHNPTDDPAHRKDLEAMRRRLDD